VVLALVAYPTVYAIVTSLHKWNLTMPVLGKTFVGLQNFARLFRDDVFLQTLQTTFSIVAVSVTIEFVIGVALALVMQHPLPGMRAARALIIAPTMIAPVVAGLIWKYMNFAGYGIVPYILGQFGIKFESGILATPGVALAAIIVTNVWQWTPFVILVTLAGLQGLQKDQVEAAQIDGAGPWQLFRNVTLPFLKPVLLFTVLIRMMDSMKIFDPVYAMTKGGPDNSTMTVTFFAYYQGLSFFEMGYAAAVSLVILFIVLILSQILIRVVYRNERV
jgi:multiple sugar transport system permease protein